MANTEAAIRKQIEFYFSEANFRKDTFLRCAAENDAEGFVPIATLLTFNKMKALTSDVSAVAAALKGSEEVVVSEDGTKVRRKGELPETDTSKARTLYAKGYPVDDDKVTIESIAEEFSVHGKVLMVRMRKDPATKLFKGGCFVEFSDEETMNKAIAKANENPDAIKACETGHPLLCVLSMNEWLERKANKKKRFKEKKASEEAEEASKKVTGKRGRDDNSASNNSSEAAEVKDAKVEVQFTPGLIMKLRNIPPEVSLGTLKDIFRTKGVNVKYVDHDDGQSEGYVRMATVEDVASLTAALKEGITVSEGDVKFEGELISGEEETAYWTKITDESKKRSTFQRGGGGRGGKRGGRGGGRGFKKGRGSRRD